MKISSEWDSNVYRKKSLWHSIFRKKNIWWNDIQKKNPNSTVKFVSLHNCGIFHIWSRFALDFRVQINSPITFPEASETDVIFLFTDCEVEPRLIEYMSDEEDPLFLYRRQFLHPCSLKSVGTLLFRCSSLLNDNSFKIQIEFEEY